MKRRVGSSHAPRKQRGPRPEAFRDSEGLTVLLVGELCHRRPEQAGRRQVRASYHFLFPALPEGSRVCRRAQRVRERLRDVRAAILFWADVDTEPLRILESFPMPLCAGYRIQPSSLPISGSTLGDNASKRQFFFGLHPGLLLSGSGFMDVAPGNADALAHHRNDPPLLEHSLNACLEQGGALSGQAWYRDTGFGNKKLKQAAFECVGVNLLPRPQEKKGESASFWQLLQDKIRKPIEGVLCVLRECLGIEHLLVKTDLGLYGRTQAKATAFSLARHFNHILGLEPMNIARYAV